MNVVNDGGIISLNGETTYNALRTYGLSDGTYTITGVPSVHPVAIVSDLSQNIVYNGTSEETIPSNSIAGYTYYSGTVTITVNGDFQQASLHCSNHGYMGGENLLVYSS
jgi:hypothetical protein